MTLDNIIGRQSTMLQVMGPSRSGPQHDSGQHHRTAVIQSTILQMIPQMTL